MTTILHQDADGLHLYESEREFPTEKRYWPNTFFEDAVKQWFKEARRFPCKDVEKFIEFAADINKTYGKTTIFLQKQGIQIPSDCYEIKNGQIGLHVKRCAFFKQPAPPPVNEADLWDEVCKILLLNTPVVFGLTEVKKRFSITRKPQP